MRIVLNTRTDDMASRVCIHDLHARLVRCGFDAVKNDWNHYSLYDVAVFMGYDHELAEARKRNPRLRLVLADPKAACPEYEAAATAADCLLVSSVEQRDYFLRYCSNVMIYYMFPEMKYSPRVHAARDSVILGYHGNRPHLEAIDRDKWWAIGQLSQSRPLEFWAMYNHRKPCRFRSRIANTNGFAVRHIPWSPENYYRELAQVDIGLVPNSLPAARPFLTRWMGQYGRLRDAYCFNDYVTRYKVSSNPGRLYVFAQLGIPVVADFFPSAAQFITHGRSGFLADSAEGWYDALFRLAASRELRASCAEALHARCLELADADRQVAEFIDCCRAPSVGRPARYTRIPRAVRILLAAQRSRQNLGKAALRGARRILGGREAR